MMTLTRPIHRLAVCAATLLTLVSTAGAQASPATRLSGRIPAVVHGEIVAVIDSAGASGLPAEPLVQKALEGATKRAEARRIALAVRTLAGELRTARQALGDDATTADLVAGASALHAGVSPDVLRRLRRDRQKQPLTIALGVMAELIARGVPATQATTTVLALIERGARDDLLVAFGRDVERDIGMGAPPAVATEVRSGGFLNRALSAGADAAPEMTNTGPTNAPQPSPPRKP